MQSPADSAWVNEERIAGRVRLLFVLSRRILWSPRHQIGVPRLDLLFEFRDRGAPARARPEIDELPIRRQDIVTVLGGTTAALTLSNVSIDDFIFGVASRSAEGFESPVAFPGPAGAFGRP